jgi:Tfp pilus assembly protein PilO
MAQDKQQLNTLLDKFYHNPVALVSFELFLSIAAIIFFAVFAIRPTLLTMSDLIKEIEDKRKLATQMEQKVTALSAAQENFASAQERIAVLDEAIPRGVNMVQTLKIIEKLASDQNLSIANLTVLKIPPDPPVTASITELERQSMPIQVVITGTYEGIREFAEQLRNSRRSFVIERITFSTEDARGQKTLEANMLIGAPFFGVKAE